MYLIIYILKYLDFRLRGCHAKVWRIDQSFRETWWLHFRWRH